MYGTRDLIGLQLVEAFAGLTCYSFAPHTRPPSLHLDSVLVDELVFESKTGANTKHSIASRYAPHMSGLSLNPIEEGRIRGGYSEYGKGVMTLKFALPSNPPLTEKYIIVFGYITGNDLNGQLSENAMFTPVCSWKVYKRACNYTDLNGQVRVVTKIGPRTDYMLNDGSYEQYHGLATVRPMDVIANAGDGIIYEDIRQQAAEEGITASDASITSSLSGINNIGIVTSNRRNYNTTKYANELLNSFTGVCGALSENNGLYNNTMIDTSMYGAEIDMLSEACTTLASGEPDGLRDEFLMTMKDLNGTSTYRGFRGWLIRDIVEMFPNFEQTIPEGGFTLMDTDRFEVVDFKQIARQFGSTSLAETISQEIVFSILDLLIANGLAQLKIEASNIDNLPGEDPLGNISIIPYEAGSLVDDDYDIGQKAIDLCQSLKEQIFTRLNGYSPTTMTPLRVSIETELLGITQVTITMYSEEYPNGSEYYFAFPTYAPSTWSPIMSTMEESANLTQSIYGNIKSYFVS